MGFPLIEISPSSELLPIILEDEQYITIHENESTENLKERVAEIKNKVNNKLEAFFKLNEFRLHEIKTINETYDLNKTIDNLYYHETPTYYTWNNENKFWQERKRACRGAMTEIDTLGQILFVPLKQRVVQG